MIDPALRDQVIQRLLAASDIKVSPAEVTDATSLRDHLDISSLILITLASELEGALGIEFEDEELSHIQTIGQLFAAIEKSQQRSRSA